MHAALVPPKLRLPVLALALSTFLLFCFLRAAHLDDTNAWSAASLEISNPRMPDDVNEKNGGPSELDRVATERLNTTLSSSRQTNLSSTTSPTLSPGIARPEPSSVAMRPRKRRAIVTAIWDYPYASMALMLGHSIRQHNDLEALGVELVLLTLNPDDEWLTGLTSWNKTVLQDHGGWKIRAESLLEVPGVNLTQIQAHRRLNLNKLKIFGWEEYERIAFIDADCIVKGSLEELFKLPAEVEFAAAQDSWPQVELDSRFNSGMMIFSPSRKLFDDMVSKLADPKYHDPREGDQQFLQNYWKFRDYKLPSKFNLNLVHYAWRKKEVWDRVFPDARIIHFTDRKPREWWRGGWCENPPAKPPKLGPKECAQIEVLKWYKKEFEKMRRDLNLENEIGILG